MKVLQINAIYEHASTGRTTQELHEFLEENNVESYVACAYSNENKEVFCFGVKFENFIHGIMSRLTGKQAYYSHIGTLRLLNYIKKVNPDIVHLRVLHSNCIHLPILLNYLSENSIATVLTLHDCWYFTGKCCYYTVKNCYQWIKGCSSCQYLREDNPSLFLDRTKKVWLDKKKLFNKIENLAVVGVSDWITNEARISFLSRAKIVKRIYNWVDLSVFKPMSSSVDVGISNSSFKILGIASNWKLNDRKGLNYFIKLSYLIPEDWTIVLAGTMSHNIVLPTNIKCLGSIDSKRTLAHIYNQCDVFMNFSLEETFGKVSAESISCGTPVVAVRSTANTEIVNNKCGYLVDNLEIDEIYAKLIDVEKKGKAYFSSNCRNFAESNFNKYSNMKEYLDLYHNLTK